MFLSSKMPAIGFQRSHLAIFLVLTVLQHTTTVDAVAFAYKSGSQVQADGGPLYFMGFNAYWMAATASYGDGFLVHVDNVLDAAWNLKMKVVRSWAFNDGLPISPGHYDESQFKGLDYVVAGAGKRGLRLVLAISNIWPAYKGPEDWLTWAEGSADGKSVADFYASQATIDLFKSHVTNLTSRVNTNTGVAYKDDPAIMAWDLINEPRCPGCDSSQMKARDNFIRTMTAHLKTVAPNQLTYSSTEGYFAPGDQNANYNPGAGAQCEGEYWSQEIDYFDVATAHVYERQMEAMKDWGWQHPSFDFYVQFLAYKLKLYSDLAGGSGRPFVLEEFGLSYRFFGEEERKIVFAVVADAVIAAKRAGKPLMGAMFWNAAYGGQPDVGGYNVYVTKVPSGNKVGLGNAASLEGTDTQSSTSSSTKLSSSSSSYFSSNSYTSPQQTSQAGRKMLRQASKQLQAAANSAGKLNGTTYFAGTANTAGVRSKQRKLKEFTVDNTQDSLDGFRRGPQRASCANSAAYGWQMGSVPTTVNVAAYRQMVKDHDIVDILAEAGASLSS